MNETKPSIIKDSTCSDVGTHELAWEHYQGASASQQAKALKTLRALEFIGQLEQAGWSLSKALAAYNEQHNATVGRTTVMCWKRTIRNVPCEHWLAYLTPKRKGPKSTHARCSEEAWDFIKADWLRPEKPTISACYRRLQQAASEQGWVVPCEKTLARWLHALPIEVVKRAREGRNN